MIWDFLRKLLFCGPIIDQYPVSRIKKKNKEKTSLTNCIPYAMPVYSVIFLDRNCRCLLFKFPCLTMLAGEF